MQVIEERYDVFTHVNELEIKIKCSSISDAENAEEICKYIYEVGVPARGEFEPPFEIIPEQAFACIYQFVDGGQLGRIMYRIFVQIDDEKIWEIYMSVDKRYYETGRMLFDQISNTLKLLLPK